MKVWFDHQIFALQRFGGYTRYFIELARALSAKRVIEPVIVAPAHVCEFFRDGDPLHSASFHLPWPKLGLRMRPAILAPVFHALASVGLPDIVHETHYVLHGRHIPTGSRIVCTCHDMIPERLHDGSAVSSFVVALKRSALSRADCIICVSNATQSDLDHYYPDLARRSVVIHHGVSDTLGVTAGTIANLPEPFILFVGDRRGYKNFQRGLRALTATHFFSDGGHLVCFGGGALRNDEMMLMAELGVCPDRVRQVSGNDEILESCFRKALALLFPSEHEGFGMPLTEAMVRGCPIICSEISAFTEVCAEAAVYFDPNDIDSMRQALLEVTDSSDLRQSLKLSGQKRGQAFSWQRCAEQTAACYLGAPSADSQRG